MGKYALADDLALVEVDELICGHRERVYRTVYECQAVAGHAPECHVFRKVGNVLAVV